MAVQPITQVIFGRPKIVFEYTLRQQPPLRELRCFVYNQEITGGILGLLMVERNDLKRAQVMITFYRGDAKTKNIMSIQKPSSEVFPVMDWQFGRLPAFPWPMQLVIAEANLESGEAWLHNFHPDIISRGNPLPVGVYTCEVRLASLLRSKKGRHKLRVTNESPFLEWIDDPKRLLIDKLPILKRIRRNKSSQGVPE